MQRAQRHGGYRGAGRTRQLRPVFPCYKLGAIGPLLSRAGLDLVMMGAPPGETEMHAYRHLVEQPSRGRAGGGGAHSAATTRASASRFDCGVPFVAHGRTEETRPYAHLDIDGEAAFAQATRRLIGFGHRYIGLLNAPEDYMFAHLRAKGWRHRAGAGRAAAGPRAACGAERGKRLRADATATGVAGPAERVL